MTWCYLRNDWISFNVTTLHFAMQKTACYFKHGIAWYCKSKIGPSHIPLPKQALYPDLIRSCRILNYFLRIYSTSSKSNIRQIASALFSTADWYLIGWDNSSTTSKCIINCLITWQSQWSQFINLNIHRGFLDKLH